MKNRTMFLGIIAIVAIIGFTFTACGGDGGGGGRTLRITGLSQFANDWVIVIGDSDREDYAAVASLNINAGIATGVRIPSNGEVTLNLWRTTDFNFDNNFAGGDTDVDFGVIIMNRATVSFDDALNLQSTFQAMGDLSVFDFLVAGEVVTGNLGNGNPANIIDTDSFYWIRP
jgi:hypothetical protein